MPALADEYLHHFIRAVEAWHEHFKRSLIGCDELPNGGTAGISTTTLSVGEFSEFLNKVHVYAIDELGIEI